jgi:hypothetical protein
MVLAMLCLTPFVSAQTKTLITSSYDKFKDITTVAGTVHLLSCEDTTIPMHTDMVAGYNFSGTTLSNIPDKIVLIYRDVTSIDSDKKMQDGDKWIVILDAKERILLGNASVKNSERIAITRKPSNLIQQSATAFISYENLKKLAKAKSIEMQIGNLERSAPNNDKLQKSLPLFKELDTTISNAIVK